MRIGIDVGGTNTDAALINKNTIIKTFKTNTSKDITSSVSLCIKELIKNQEKQNIDSIIIGTTHLINDLIQRKNLPKTAINL